jgi:spore germination protein KA
MEKKFYPALQKDLQINRKLLDERFENCFDIIFRDILIGRNQVEGFIIYLDGLVNHEIVNESILKPLLLLMPQSERQFEEDTEIEKWVKKVLPNSSIEIALDLKVVIQAVLKGQTALFLDHFNKAVILNTPGREYRSVSEPDTESVVRGPREGFVEAIGANVSLLRNKIKDEDLRMERLWLGKRTQTKIYITYIKGLANEKLVEEVRKRLNSIDIDAILESGYIEQLIEDAPQSIFPTVGNTEKPDILAAKLLEGRVGILVDGTPFVLTVPFLLVEAFQSAEDYYSRPYYTSVVRVLRYLAFSISVFLPAAFVALQTFNQEMIPTDLLISMSAAREGVPFPAYIEVIMMGVIFEILREAGVRMPRPVGQAVSIVGALVLGEAAVSGGLVGETVVIVVALTSISGFVLTALADAGSLLRFYFVFAAASMGLFGSIMAIIALFIHLTSLRSFGVPYLSPIMPASFEGLKDTVVRFPLWALISRPHLVGSGKRQGKNGWRRWKDKGSS